MKKHILTGFFFLFLPIVSLPQEKVKNLILMIPDGTSAPVLTLSRWYRFGACPADNCRLAVDPYICGLVRTYNSDSPIGDSAPTGSTYSTGYLSNTGFVATYPVSSGQAKDLFRIDSSRSYHPLTTILEAARIMGKSTGLVVTCQFPHATPADFSAHTADRNQYYVIAKQIVHNHLNVVFGGGTRYLSPKFRNDSTDLFSVLTSGKYKLITDYSGFRQVQQSDSLVWGLFAEDYLPYELDRDPGTVPSLAEMTRKAMQILSKDPDGFFLMVEGSKIDWAAHANDGAGMVTEFLAFDDAVKEAMDFANRDGYTAVIVVPDHGNSGISIGNQRSSKGYDTLGLKSIIDPLKQCRHTAEGIAKMMLKKPDQLSAIFTENTGLNISTRQRVDLQGFIRKNDFYALVNFLTEIINENGFIGFTTHGHTGEEVMLAVYHPGNYRPSGIITNTELHQYLTDILNTPDLDSLTDRIFCIDTTALSGLIWNINTAMNENPRLIIRQSPGSKTYAVIESGTDFMTVYLKGKPLHIIPFNTLALYVEPLHHFFLPRNISDLLPAKMKGK